MTAADISALASLVTAFAMLGIMAATVRGQRRITTKVESVVAKIEDVHTEVKTQNGITLAVPADRQECRRIIDEVPAAERTVSERGYVDKLEEGGRNMGHEKSP